MIPSIMCYVPSSVEHLGPTIRRISNQIDTAACYKLSHFIRPLLPFGAQTDSWSLLHSVHATCLQCVISCSAEDVTAIASWWPHLLNSSVAVRLVFFENVMCRHYYNYCFNYHCYYYYYYYSHYVLSYSSSSSSSSSLRVITCLQRFAIEWLNRWRWAIVSSEEEELSYTHADKQ